MNRMPTREEIGRIAREQSAIDLGCAPEDFDRSENVFTEARLTEGTRIYYREPFDGTVVSYGSNAVAAVRPELREVFERYLSRYPFYHCFETPSLHSLDRMLEPYGRISCFQAEYWLPDPGRMKEPASPFRLEILEKEQLEPLYLPEWSNALCADRKYADRLAVGAYDREKLVGLAGCSADCEKMWQIGVDVLPAYRRKGIAEALTSALAAQTFRRGKIPFYCCAWSNVASARNAIASGFVPAWAEMSIKPTETVEKFNRSEE